MILTEEQAKTKQCHLSFAVPEIRSQDWNGVREPGPWQCATTGCMAWRWAESEFMVVKRADKPVGDDSWEDRGNGYFRKPRQDRKGYCGAAVAPTVSS